MTTKRFDVLVVGAGPAGSIAALEVARGGARVALLDKATFPRDKACGDLVGPRGLRLLEEAGIELPASIDVGDMIVVGPTGRRVRLPARPGETYPGHGTVVPRTVFDALLRTSAISAGAEPFDGRADAPLETDGKLDGFRLATGEELRADFVVGADGATSHVATTAGLVEPDKVLWGFAARTYLPEPTRVPNIVLWERQRWDAFPGYGWIFPGSNGMANVGLGIAVGSRRNRGSGAVRLFPEFLDHLRSQGLLGTSSHAPVRHLGGWLKLGIVGTTPARGRVMLVGDAAGLVNPMQGEGISQAMSSGRDAALAMLRSPGHAASTYGASLAAAHLPYHQITASAHSALVGRPRLVSAVGRLVTAPLLGAAISGGWALFWNELLDGAPPSHARTLARTSTRLGQALTATSDVARWFPANLPGHVVYT